MGSTYSQEDYDRSSLELYETALQNPCLLPDVGIDESLLKYSGIDSNAVLNAYSNELIAVPDFIVNLGSSLAQMTLVPNAVGLGALVISIIMEICIKGTQTNADSYGMLRRVFGEEKASAVRDTLSEYLRRHRMFMNNDQRMQGEIRRLEEQLSNHLTILRNSLLRDEQMSTRGFKIWVNGASFHLQMLIHEARLNIQTGKHASDDVSAIKAAISLYLQDLDNLLEKYKTYKTSRTILIYRPECAWDVCAPGTCLIENDEIDCVIVHRHRYTGPCEESEMIDAYMNHVFSKYGAVSGLKSYFSNIKNNLTSLINQHDAFTLPSIT